MGASGKTRTHLMVGWVYEERPLAYEFGSAYRRVKHWNGDLGENRGDDVCLPNGAVGFAKGKQQPLEECRRLVQRSLEGQI